MSVSKKTILLKSDFDAVYEAGRKGAYEEGYAKAESENPFYYTTTLTTQFQGATFPENYNAVIKVNTQKTLTNTFYNSSNVKSITIIADDKESKALSCDGFAWYAFDVETIDFSNYGIVKPKTVSRMFYQNYALKSIIGKFDLSENTDTFQWLNSCNKLENIEFVPNTIKTSTPFQWCTKLNNDSKASIFNGLYNYGDKTYDITDNPFRIISAMEMPMQYIIMGVGENEDGYEISTTAAADGNSYSFFAPKRNNYSQEIINALKEGTYFNIDCEIVNGDWQVNSWTINVAGSETTQTLTLPSSLKILQSQVDDANAKGWTIAGGNVVSEEEYYA